MVGPGLILVTCLFFSYAVKFLRAGTVSYPSPYFWHLGAQHRVGALVVG